MAKAAVENSVAPQSEALAEIKRNEEKLAKLENWEALKELSEGDKAAFKKIQEEAKLKKSGTPQLVNLNEDPIFDRKIVYDLASMPICTVGRRNKQNP